MQKANVNVNETSKRVTLEDIAKTAGSCVSYVRKTLTGEKNGPVAERIRETARKMNYVPRHCRTGKDLDIANLKEIPVPASPVTSFTELGELIGINGSNINKYYYGKIGSPETIAYVRAAAEHFGYAPAKRKNHRKTGYISAKDIAQRTGYSVKTVYNALEATPNTLPTSTVLKIRNAAKEMGYDPTRYQPSHTGKQNPHAYLQRSNFPSPEVEKERMEILRRQGYTNDEIAQKIGKTYQHVLTKLGTQPKAITQMSYAAAAADRRFRKQLRERYQLEEKLAEYKAAEAELEKMKEQEAALKARVIQLRPHIRRAEQLDKKIAEK